ncbi:hypothetical protein HAX54_017476, partial [Datura stramonium]|nr:hypothetical protein [Datura stramonium]
DAKIEATLSQVLAKLESTESVVNKMHEELSTMELRQRLDNDQCMAVATRSGKTTIKKQIPRIESNIDENNLDLVEAREQRSVLSDPHIEGSDVLE